MYVLIAISTFKSNMRRKSEVRDNGVRFHYEAHMTHFNMDPSAATSAWSRDFHDFILTPYDVLRCGLESTLQVKFLTS